MTAATVSPAALRTTEVPSVRVTEHELGNGGSYYQVDSDSIDLVGVIAGVFGISEGEVSAELFDAGKELGLDRIDGYAHDLRYSGHYGVEQFAVFANERMVTETFARFA